MSDQVAVDAARAAFRETFGGADEQPLRLAEKDMLWAEYATVSHGRPGRRSKFDTAYDLNVPPGSEDRVLANLRKYAASDEVAKRGHIMTGDHWLEVWTQWPEERHDQPSTNGNGNGTKQSSGNQFVDYAPMDEERRKREWAEKDALLAKQQETKS